MEEVLSSSQIKQFIEEGFVRIDNAFPPELAAEVRSILWKDMDADPGDPSSWTKPVIRLGMYSQPPFIQSANTPILHAAFDQLVGKSKWIPCRSMGSFPVRFPSAVDPGDTGWHVDVSFGDHPTNFLEWRVNWRSKNRALLMLFLYSDIGEKDAPTRIKVGSHLDIARLLKPHGESGLSLVELVEHFPLLPQRDEITATGNAGTVYLCHPFLVHAAQAHSGKEPRFLAQPPLLLKNDLMREGETGNLSPVEAAIQMGISA
ncbi:phytanoyl-CoA dioxygenase family protein [Longitalea arenae]|uniref:phytanoyl-CoA dioxygenase family protein n=1 Tax=Longitalea arenae TaxID=2812558 RepID=UPI0019676CA6|nr:phytanoyl-CoA dioxygenase family protein [Longitalea arenae]